MTPERARAHALWRGVCGRGAFWVCAGVMCLLLASCAQRPLHPMGSDYWSGRLSLHIHHTPTQRWSAGFELEGHAQRGQLTLVSPLGQAVAQARWAPGVAELRQGHSTRLFASMDDLLLELTGAALPLPALFDWLHGHPTDTVGWHVNLDQHASGRIHAQRSAPLPGMTLRVVVQHP